MKLSSTSCRLLATALCAAMLLAVSVRAEDNATSQSSPSPKATAHAPPQPPLAKPPVELFRSILDMAPAERREFLAKRSPESQKLILAKVHEYEALKPEQRELRLRVTELRWYLMPLLNSSSTNRSVQLAAVPADFRGLIEARLKQWDSLTPEMQRELIENEATVRFYFDLATQTTAQGSQASTNLSPAAQKTLDSGIHSWQALSQAQRQSVIRNFYQILNLTQVEKTGILNTLSEAERLQIEKTLNTYEGLSLLQRAQCLKSFQKFANMGPEERQQFLKNAQLWERMTPDERKSWRYLVSNLSHQPPPPGGLLPPEPPSRPSGALRTPPSVSSLATNGN
jgi:hypothetical protein